MIEVEVNGIIHEFPEGTSPDVMRSALQRTYGAPTPKPSFGDNLMKSGQALLQGGGQALSGGFLDEAVSALTALGSDKPFKDAYAQNLKSAQGFVGDTAKENPYSYVGGNIIGGLLGAGAAGATSAGKAVGGMLGSGTTGARIGKGMLSGGVVGGVYGAGGSESGERLQGAAQGGLLGAITGGAIPAVSSLGKSASSNELAKKAKDFGIDLNLTQVLDSKVAKRFQDLSQNIPFSGYTKNREKQLAQFNKAVSKQFGQDISEFTMENIDEAFIKAGKPFNDILKGQVIDVTPDMIKQVDDIIIEASDNIDPSKVAILKNNADKLKNALGFDANTGQYTKTKITGEVLNSIRSTLSNNAGKADPIARPYIADLVDTVVDISSKGNPEVAKQLNEARKNYKNLNVALKAWDSTTNSINPVKLENAVKSNAGYGLRNYSRGYAKELGDLAQIGKTFLPEAGGSTTIPNVITAGGSGGLIAAGFDPASLTIAGSVVGGNRLLQELNRNPAIVNRMLSGGASTTQNPLISGQIGGMLGAQQ